MRKFDDVNGEVIGEVFSVKAFLTYDDRQQCKEQFYKSEQESIKDMLSIQRDIIKNTDKRIIDYIYPDNNAWRVRIYEL